MLLQLAVALPLLYESFVDECNKSNAGQATPKKPTTTTTTMAASLTDEEKLRQATESCLRFWLRDTSQQQSDQLSQPASFSSAPKDIHDECLVTLCSGEENNLTTSSPGESFCLGATARGPDSSALNDNSKTPTNNNTIKVEIHWVKILPVGNRTSATVRVTCQSTTQGFLSFLKSSSGWICIHAAFSSTQSTPVLPWDFQEVNQLIWERYRQANRLCDGQLMATAFHETCRLTFVTDGQLVLIPQTEFCAMVQDRYTLELHKKYAKLQEHPDVEIHDTLEAIEFAAPNLCLVTLKVGHPPCLWTDFLVCCNMGPKGWWIVHKASCHDEFPLNSEMKQVLEGELSF